MRLLLHIGSAGTSQRLPKMAALLPRTSVSLGQIRSCPVTGHLRFQMAISWLVVGEAANHEAQNEGQADATENQARPARFGAC